MLEKIKPPTFTWCSSCRRPFKDPNNHQHSIPKLIQKKAGFVTKLGDQFSQKKLTFRRLLHRLLHKDTDNHSLPENGMQWTDK